MMLALLSSSLTSAFQPLQQTKPTTLQTRFAGGFEWEDPTSEVYDQGVENPFKNPDLMISKETTEGDEAMKIDPARLLGPRLNGANLYFIGMMGSGKTAVGDVVARRMGSYNFLDTDEIIEKATNMTIPEIFDSEGEEGFRNVESQILASVHSYVRCVVSTGGGLITKLENWAKLQSGVVIWLDPTPEIIYERLQNNGDNDRPLLQCDDPLQKLKDLLQERKDKYSQADLRIEIDSSDMDTAAVADQVVRELHDFIDENPPAWKLAKAKAQSEGLDWVQ